MQKVQEIIELLTSAEGSLQSALLKTKVLLADLGESQSQKWINNELTGYSNDDNNVPDYRLIYLQVWGDVADNAGLVTPNKPLSVFHLEEKLKNALTRVYFKKNIGFIEEAKKDNPNGNSVLEVRYSIIPEIYPHLSEPLGAGYVVKEAWNTIASYAEVKQIVMGVKSRLLDFILALSERIPSDIDNKEGKPVLKSSDITKLFNNTVLGDNVTVIIGDNNVSKIKNSVIKNDIKPLEKTLKENKIKDK